ncbi:MAG: hypothetical protein LBJ12_02555 [Oscillospiraceae bacterium]|jgi:hypothetical protein|nr:hypothetical protein [Oscillospiraceae bacterium]
MFVDAYNKFGGYKMKYRRPASHRPPDGAAKHLHHFKDLPCQIIDFLDVPFLSAYWSLQPPEKA